MGSHRLHSRSSMDCNLPSHVVIVYGHYQKQPIIHQLAIFSVFATRPAMIVLNS